MCVEFPNGEIRKRRVFQAVQVTGARMQTKAPASSPGPASASILPGKEILCAWGSILDRTVLDHRRIHARKTHTIGGN